MGRPGRLSVPCLISNQIERSIGDGSGTFSSLFETTSRQRRKVLSWAGKKSGSILSGEADDMAIGAIRRLKARLGIGASDEGGATMIEYGLLAALLAVALIATLGFVSGGLDGVFQAAGNEMEAAAASAAG